MPADYQYEHAGTGSIPRTATEEQGYRREPAKQ